MGQQVAALCLGVKVKDCTVLRDDEGDWFPRVPELRIETGDGDFSFIAIPVAVQNVPEDDEVDMPECAVNDIKNVLRKELKRARGKWKKIDAWAKSHRVILGTPRLLLMNVERA